ARGLDWTRLRCTAKRTHAADRDRAPKAPLLWSGRPARRSSSTETDESRDRAHVRLADLRDCRTLALDTRGERLPLRRRQLGFPQPDRARRHLDRLILADELECLLERERPRRNQ